MPETAPGSPCPPGGHFCSVRTALEHPGAPWSWSHSPACVLRLGKGETRQTAVAPKSSSSQAGWECPPRLRGAVRMGVLPQPSSAPEAPVCVRPSQAWHRAETAGALPYFRKCVGSRGPQNTPLLQEVHEEQRPAGALPYFGKCVRSRKPAGALPYPGSA